MSDYHELLKRLEASQKVSDDMNDDGIPSIYQLAREAIKELEAIVRKYGDEILTDAVTIGERDQTIKELEDRHENLYRGLHALSNWSESGVASRRYATKLINDDLTVKHDTKEDNDDGL